MQATSEVDRYREWEASPPLGRYVACTWARGPQVGRPEPVLPDGCMDIIWDGGRLFVAGPDRGPRYDAAHTSFAVGVRFRPGAGPLFVGPPAGGLVDQTIDLEAIWPRASLIAEELASSSTGRQAAGVLENWAMRRLPVVAAPDRVVEAGVALWSGGAEIGTATLARRAGITERQLHRRFVAAVGYGPKLLQRVVRFQAFLAACRPGAPGLAVLAAGAGYADQAHLSREAQSLAGLTPSRLRATRLHV